MRRSILNAHMPIDNASGSSLRLFSSQLSSNEEKSAVYEERSSYIKKFSSNEEKRRHFEERVPLKLMKLISPDKNIGIWPRMLTVYGKKSNISIRSGHNWLQYPEAGAKSFFALCHCSMTERKTMILDYYLEKELSIIQDLLDSAHMADTKGYEGSINVQRNKSGVYIFVYNKGKKRYLGTLSSQKVRSFVSLNTICRMEPILKREEELLQEFKRRLEDSSLERSKIECCRGVFSASETISDPVTANLINWAEEDYEKNSLPMPDRVILTKDGTRVRSNDECTLYNRLLDEGIPFRYDSIIELIDQNGNIVRRSPDFLIKTRSGNFIIIEHLGEMSDDDYASRNGKKIGLYISNGFVFGKTLFLTNSMSGGGVDTEALESVIAQVKIAYFCY